jgi:hypothetical protein
MKEVTMLLQIIQIAASILPIKYIALVGSSMWLGGYLATTSKDEMKSQGEKAVDKVSDIVQDIKSGDTKGVFKTISDFTKEEIFPKALEFAVEATESKPQGVVEEVLVIAEKL